MHFFIDLWDNARPHLPLAAFLSETIARLLLAAILGGIIGLERELKHKPAGLRTNMFICFGAAMFTVLSFKFTEGVADPTRIASNIIPGIGFIGAGSILHSRGAVSGLTTAATLFVVASIGMAAGGGEYLPAIFATLVILVALNLLGWAEQRFNLKSSMVGYAVLGKNPEDMLAAINKMLQDMQLSMQSVQLGGSSEGMHRLHFTVEARPHQQQELAERLRRESKLDRVEMMRSSNGE
jgi:putative Mg2+ transporter-C (MgtC) family protein